MKLLRKLRDDNIFCGIVFININMYRLVYIFNCNNIFSIMYVIGVLVNYI